MSRYAPNARLILAAHQLEQLAQTTTTALDHIQHELNTTDSYPTRTPGASIATATGNTSVCPSKRRNPPEPCDGCDVCMPMAYTPTERAALARYALTAQQEQIRDDINAIESLITSYAHILRRTLGMRLPTVTGTTRRCDATGHEGAALARTDGGWSDPTCQDIADKAGLCSKCYMRKRRFLIRTGQPTRDDSEAA